MQDRDVLLAIAEDDRVLDLLRLDQFAQDLSLGVVVAVGAEHEALGDERGCGCRACCLNAFGRGQELVGEARDLGRHCGREEQRLSLGRQQLADLLDVRNEAHVEHSVGFVDDQDFDAHQHDPPAAEQIEQPAWRRDQNIDTAVELHRLVFHRDAADQQRNGELVILAVFLKALRHLGCQFARRGEDQRARHAGAGAAHFQAADHRHDEGCRLAGACLGNTENISPRDGDRDCLDLDGSGRRVTGGRDGLQHFGAETELSEGRGFQKSVSGGAQDRHTCRQSWGASSVGEGMAGRSVPRSCIHRPGVAKGRRIGPFEAQRRG